MNAAFEIKKRITRPRERGALNEDTEKLFSLLPIIKDLARSQVHHFG